MCLPFGLKAGSFPVPGGRSEWKKNKSRHLPEAEEVILSVYPLDPVCMISITQYIYIYTYNLPTYTTKIYPFKVGIIIYSLIKNHHLHGVVVVSVKAFFCVIKFDLTCHGGKKTATEAQVDQDMKKEQDRKAGTERKNAKGVWRSVKFAYVFFKVCILEPYIILCAFLFNFFSLFVCPLMKKRNKR